MLFFTSSALSLFSKVITVNWHFYQLMQQVLWTNSILHNECGKFESINLKCKTCWELEHAHSLDFWWLFFTSLQILTIHKTNYLFKKRSFEHIHCWWNNNNNILKNFSVCWVVATWQEPTCVYNLQKKKRLLITFHCKHNKSRCKYKVSHVINT